MKLQAAILLLLAGCNQILGVGDFHTGGGDDGPIDASVDAMTQSACGPLAGPGEVVGCATVTHVLADGTSFVTKRDMTVFTVSVLVADDSPAGYQTINGIGSEDGVFRIEGVPDEPYFLRLHDVTDPSYPYPHYFYTDERDLDLGIVVRGRDDTPATLATQVTVQVDGMTPWKTPDGIQLSSINNGSFADLLPATAVDATTLDETVDWQTVGQEVTFSDIHDYARLPQLVDSAAPPDDDLHVLHYRAGSITLDENREAMVQTLVDTADLDVTMTNGSAVTATGTFAATTPVATPQQISMNLNSARDALPDGTRYGSEAVRCQRWANPAADQGITGAALSLFNTEPLTPTMTFVQATFPYANPFPTAWGHMMSCTFEHVHVTELPGGAAGRFGFSYINSFTSVTDSFTWTPATQGPENIRIGGVDAMAGGTVAFDGVAPVTISWDPVVGVSHYAVRALGAIEALVAKFDTTETSIAMPADLFTPGRFYVFRVYAIQTSGDYAGGKLLEVGRPAWIARVATGYFRFSSLCGNGTIDGTEQCDPGPDGNSNTCDSDCTLAVCGDGFRNAAALEQCDEPANILVDANITDTGQCDDDCQVPQCNDGHWNRLLEECDDNNAVETDGCTSACVLTSCGDGTTQGPFEGCDDGNRVNGDGCDAFCQPDLDLR